MKVLRPVPFLLCLFAVMLPAYAEITVSKAEVDKIFYDPGDKITVTVAVKNTDAEAVTANLRVELISDVDTHRMLHEETTTFPAGQVYSFTTTATAEPVLGMELKASVVRDGQPVATKSDYFSCARCLHQMLIAGASPFGGGWQFSGTVDNHLDRYPLDYIASFRASYGNFNEKFAWGPSDFDDLTPDSDKWWAGQTQYNESKRSMIATINEAHRQGISVVTYGKAAAGGLVGYEKMRRHPDIVGYTNGRFWGGYDAAYLDYLNVLGPPKFGETRGVPGSPAEMEKAGYTGAGWFAPFTDGGQNWCDLWYDSADPRVATIGIGELVGSAKMFGFDGVRFDGEFAAGRSQRLDGSWNMPENFDSEAANTALVQQMKKECWAQKRNYLFGYNGGTDITWSIGGNNVPASFREKCKDGGMIANEAMAFPGDIPWTEYCLHIRHRGRDRPPFRRLLRHVLVQPQCKLAVQLHTGVWASLPSDERHSSRGRGMGAAQRHAFQQIALG